MAGLLDGVLPAIYSAGDRAKRQLSGLLSDPLGSLQLAFGKAYDDLGALDTLQQQAFSDPRRPLAVTDQAAFNKLSDAYLNGVMNFAPIGMVQPLAKRETDAAMKAVGYERGWYRGGPKIEGSRKSGDWYTQDAQEAADYAKRFGDKAEVREYAVPQKMQLKFDASYNSRLANDIATQVEGMGEAGAKLAKELRRYGPNDRPTGLEVWRGLSKFIGDDVAMDVVGRLGFNGVRGVNSPSYLRVFPKTTVRDANQAKFDPARILENDIYGRADPMLMGGLAALAGGGYAGFHSLADE